MEKNTDKVNYGEIIKKLRIKNSMTQTELGQLVSLGKTAISNYETGYVVPPLSVLENIAKVFNLSLLEVLTYDTEPELYADTKFRQASNSVIIPYIHVRNVKESVLNTDQYMDDTLTLPTSMTNDNKGYVCIKMNDDGMKSDGISRNDYLIVKKEAFVKPGQIVLALNNENSTYTIRRYIREGHIASLIPSSDSERYPVVRIDERDAKFTIAGYVESVFSKINY
ncbi:MAG: helix-turn-helix domain-containing protein [Clostridia bacterium]|nr:helix-turn-helix domain-containing protein [Clostridia bacterium]